MTPMTDAQLLEWVKQRVQMAQGKKMYGSLTINFEKGRITTMKAEQTEKPGAHR